MTAPIQPGPWPPTHHQAHYERMRIWDAWYAGDPARLTAVYSGSVGDTRHRNRPSQSAGGIVGAIARMFWGRPTPAGEAPSKLHIPIAADIATTSADLLFSKPPTITVPDTDTQDRLDYLLKKTCAHRLFLEAAEVASALSGVYLRLTTDPSVKHPILSVVHPDAAIPTFRWGHLTGVTFWSVIEHRGSTIIRHMERHVPGVIENRLYTGTGSTIGEQMPLTGHDATARLLPAMPTGIDMLTAVYVPNVLPNRLDRTSDQGTSDYTSLEPLMDGLDQVWTSLMRDIDNGVGRVFVPQDYLRHMGRGNGAEFDPDRRFFTGLNMPPDGSSPLTVSQFAIRVLEHLDSAMALTKQIIRGSHFSLRSFGIAEEVQVTATEIVADKDMSLATQAKKTRYFRPALEHITTAMLALDNAKYAGKNAADPTAVEFPAALQQDPQKIAGTVDLLHRAVAASLATKVAMVHPDWDDPRIQVEVDAIMAETGQAVADPETAFTQPLDQVPVPAPEPVA